MAEREIKAWITINHKHIPLYEGESKQDAYNRAIAKDNEDKKKADIEQNKKQADKLNGKEVSNVETRTTSMSKTDAAHISSGPYAYFQSWKAFEVNEALRKSADEEIDLDEALDSTDIPSSDVDGFKKTIEIMDRNMQPIDESMQVARFADKYFLTSVMDKLDFYDGQMISRLMSDGTPYDPPFLDGSDVKVLKDKLLGAKITEASYMSSMYSLDDGAKSVLARPIVFKLSLSKGTKGMFSPTGKESEFVIARNSTYEITDIQIGTVNNVPKLIIHAVV